MLPYSRLRICHSAPGALLLDNRDSHATFLPLLPFNVLVGSRRPKLSKSGTHACDLANRVRRENVLFGGREVRCLSYVCRHRKGLETALKHYPSWAPIRTSNSTNVAPTATLHSCECIGFASSFARRREGAIFGVSVKSKVAQHMSRQNT